jgi:HAD superfamily hydrolase (TIGR01509 family)
MNNQRTVFIQKSTDTVKEMELKAVVFDFDGVCIDTEMARYLSWQRIYESFALEFPREEWIKNIGKATNIFDPYPHLERLVGRTLDKETILATHYDADIEITNGMPLQPGFAERLDEAASRGMKCAIASSSSHRWVDGHLRYRGLLDRFAVTVCREDTVSHKPHPEPYRTALRLMGVESGRAVAVEDSPLGIASARAAGLFCIGVPCSMTKDMDLGAAELLVGSLREVTFDAIDGIIAKRNCG